MIDIGAMLDDLIINLQGVICDDALLMIDEPKEIHIVVPPTCLVNACVFVSKRLDAPLSRMTGFDERERTGMFRLAYVFSADGKSVSVEAAIDPAETVFPSVSPYLPAAKKYESEIQGLLGVIPQHKPDLH